ncbi:MAG: hypothetical protein JJU11_04530 [Candidatus Sumerlaeia bacterium]|nr:hypothetical protein [Candidatus Sumerlaeia bacterium]
MNRILEGHEIHRLHEFVPHMARLQPDLVTMLPEQDRPEPGVDLEKWVLSLPQKRLMEISTVWVLEALSRLRRQSPLTNVLLRGCLTLEGEFDLSDAGAVATGEEIGPENPRRLEIRRALNRAARAGILIHLPSVDRYCIPFPVRLSFDGVDFMDDFEREMIRWRTVRHFAHLAAQEPHDSELGDIRHWRFTNLIAAFETAVELMEELLGMEGAEWAEYWEELRQVPEELAAPLLALARLLGRAIVTRQSESGHRLLAAGAAAAAHLTEREARGGIINLIGQFHLKRGAFRRAYSAFQVAEAAHGVAQSWRSAILGISAQAIVLREAGNLHVAATQFLRAARIAEKRRLPDIQIDNANCAARIYLSLGSAREAVDALEPMLANIRVDATFPARAETLLLLGTALLECGRPIAARPHLFAALSDSRDLIHRPVEAQACLQVARLFHEEGKRREAINWARRSHQLHAEMSSHGGQCDALLELFRLSRESMGREGAGDQLPRRALRHAQAARDSSREADAWQMLLEVVRDEEDDSEIVLRCRLMECLRQTWRHRDLVQSHLGLASAYEGKRAYLAAAGELLRGQAIARSLELTRELGEIDGRVPPLLRKLSQPEVDYLTEEISDELESGKLFRQPQTWPLV